MKTSKLAIVVSFILGGVAGAVAYNYLGAFSDGSSAFRSADRFPTLSMSETTRGELTQASSINLKDGSRYQAFILRPDQTGLLRIEQEGALDAQMVLLNEDREVVQTSSEGELFSYFESTPEQTLTLIVSGLDFSSYGPFRLNTEWLEVINEGELTFEDSIQGYLSGAPNQYQLVVEEAGMYQIDMSTSLFDSYLRIEGNGVNATDDDSGSSLNARLSVMLEPGEYTVTATTPYGDASDTFGTFNLQATKLNGMDDYQQGGSVELGQRVMGFLQNGSMNYTLTVEEDSQVRIALNSDAFDTVLEVQGGDVTLYDDDGGTGTNSLISEQLPAGEYSILVRGFSSGQGAFTLDIQ
ncbi:hypothetical protein CWE12_00770 [Aliidiomarina sedimenti]|uniref:Serine protease n=1 Tax=Aliidiomarina sedimenti TaxID=1933879 RepID=A0ABY0C1E4_9GAMM|nr:hypothetical protein [Aliidiomarina sedimenti]RUO31565.1 hypothetical protein CWE12_00770 [Aliidiomarina sedimenti]